MPTLKQSKAIIITGGIATGKSTTVSILQRFGFQIIDADVIGHQLLNDNSSQISNIFGTKYLNDDNTVNRKKLGSMIFANKEARFELEALMHPLIRQGIKEQSSVLNKQNQFYFIDIPLYFEQIYHYQALSDVVLLIYAPFELQLRRLKARNNFDDQRAKNYLNSQISIEQKKRKAKIIIDNTQDIIYLEKTLKKILKELHVLC